MKYLKYFENSAAIGGLSLAVGEAGANIQRKSESKAAMP